MQGVSVHVLLAMTKILTESRASEAKVTSFDEEIYQVSRFEQFEVVYPASKMLW